MSKTINKPKQAKTEGISDIITITANMGDQLVGMWEGTWDMKAAQTALNAYKTAISAAKTQVVYKKLTSKPGVIPFLEK
tara:strand:- start:1813 stop:2049 length:237 start_codon:yes stop_codon:yes gene_type:complete